MLFFVFFVGSKSDILGSFGTFLADIGVFSWISCQINLAVIYSSLSPAFWDRYPFCWPFFGSDNDVLGSFGTFQAQIFFLDDLPNQFESSLFIFFTYFCGQFDLLEGKFWGRHPYLWLFCWFKKWHFRQFCHICSTYWRTFFEMS